MAKTGSSSTPARPTPVAAKAEQKPVAKAEPKPAAIKVEKEKDSTASTTVAASIPLSAKAKFPQIVPEDSEYRPVLEIGKEAVSGNGSADNAKLENLGGCLPVAIFVDPEIFRGLSEISVVS